MQILQKETHLLIQPDEAHFEAFYKALVTNASHYQNEHVVVNLLESFETTLENLNTFSKIAADKKEAGTSFVVVCEGIEIDALEDENLSVVPTLIEAQDILDMEAMERDLGL
jgi:hypothetical protein